MRCSACVKGALVAGALAVFGSCAGYDVGVEFCIQENCIKVMPHVVHFEILEPVEQNQVGE